MADFRLIKEPALPNEEERTLRGTKDYMVGGVKMNIVDIQAIIDVESPQNDS